MSNPNTTVLVLAAASANNISTTQTPGGAGNLTITGTAASGGVATLDVARRVLISTAGNDNARSFTITGTDRNGNTQTEVVSGIPNTTSGFTQRDFKTVTRIAVDAATAGAITAGTNGTGSSEWVMDNYLAEYWNIGGGCAAPVGGGTTFQVEFTFDDPTKASLPGAVNLVALPQGFSINPLSFVPPKAWVLAAFNPGVTVDTTFSFTNGIVAHRVTITAGTGQVVMQTVQVGPGT